MAEYVANVRWVLSFLSWYSGKKGKWFRGRMRYSLVVETGMAMVSLSLLRHLSIVILSPLHRRGGHHHVVQPFNCGA